MAKNNEFSHSGEDFAKWRKAQILQTAPEEDQGQVQQQHIRHGAPSLLSFLNHDMSHPGNCKGRKTCLLRTDVSREASLWNKWTLGAGSHSSLKKLNARSLPMYTVTVSHKMRQCTVSSVLVSIRCSRVSSLFFFSLLTQKSSVTL